MAEWFFIDQFSARFKSEDDECQLLVFGDRYLGVTPMMKTLLAPHVPINFRLENPRQRGFSERGAGVSCRTNGTSSDGASTPAQASWSRYNKTMRNGEGLSMKLDRRIWHTVTVCSDTLCTILKLTKSTLTKLVAIYIRIRKFQPVSSHILETTGKPTASLDGQKTTREGRDIRFKIQDPDKIYR
jgi:hypothetical protein